MKPFREWLNLREGPYGVDTGETIRGNLRDLLGQAGNLAIQLSSKDPKVLGPALQQVAAMNDDDRQAVLDQLRSSPTTYQRVMNYLLNRRGVRDQTAIIQR